MTIDLGIHYLSDVTLIGQGGFSVVYAATDARFDRRVAVKIIGKLSSEKDRQRFERECRVMGRLSAHPNVVTVFDAGHTDHGHPYLVMELIDEGSMADRVKRDGRIPWRQALTMLIPVIDALGHGHRQGILHRDVKPENILLAGDLPRLTDFGIAYVQDASGSTSTHIAASWLHAPPETFDNQRNEQSDLYSVGSTLFSVITGQAPFWRPSEESLNPLLRRLLTEPAPHLPPDLAPHALDEVLQRCLAKEPGLRPISADALIADLQLVLGQQEPPVTQPVGPPPMAPFSYPPPGGPPRTADRDELAHSVHDSFAHRPAPPSEPLSPGPFPPPMHPPMAAAFASEAPTVSGRSDPGHLPPAGDHSDLRAKDPAPFHRGRALLIAAVAGVMVLFAGLLALTWKLGDERASDTTGIGGDAGGQGGDTTEANGSGGAASPPAGGLISDKKLVDGSTFIGGPPVHIDPALDSSFNAKQVIDALYDGLTDVDTSDPTNPHVVLDVASAATPNADATAWTFKIRDDEFFSDGEKIVPSTFARSWNRAAHMGGDYSYLIGFIDGGQAVLDGTSQEISGVKADDASMTLTVTLTAPYSSFDALVGFHFFYPIHPETAGLADQTTYESGLMKGNGPYMLEHPRNDTEITLVPNPKWTGGATGVTTPRLARIELRVMADADASFSALTAGQVDVAAIPPERSAEARQSWGTTLDTNAAGSYHWVINADSALLGGPRNLKLREAISLAINREEISRSAFGGLRAPSTGITPPAIPGATAGLCKICTYDRAAAQAAYNEWTAAGGRLSEPIPLQFNADAGHEPVAQIIIDNLAAIGIEAVAEPMPQDGYFAKLAQGGCKHICRAGWSADYPTYDNFMYDLFHSDSIGGNNLGPFHNSEFDRLVSEARRTTVDARAKSLYRQAESILLADAGVIPIAWFVGNQAYDTKKVTSLPLDPLGGIRWEQVTATT